MFVTGVAELLKLLHWKFVAIHDGNEISEILFRKALRLDMEESTIDARYTWNALRPIEERFLIKI